MTNYYVGALELVYTTGTSLDLHMHTIISVKYTRRETGLDRRAVYAALKHVLAVQPELCVQVSALDGTSVVGLPYIDLDEVVHWCPETSDSLDKICEQQAASPFLTGNRIVVRDSVVTAATPSAVATAAAGVDGIVIAPPGE